MASSAELVRRYRLPFLAVLVSTAVHSIVFVGMPKRIGAIDEKSAATYTASLDPTAEGSGSGSAPPSAASAAPTVKPAVRKARPRKQPPPPAPLPSAPAEEAVQQVAAAPVAEVVAEATAIKALPEAKPEAVALAPAATPVETTPVPEPERFPVAALPANLEIDYALKSSLADANAVYRWSREGDSYRITGEGEAEGFFALFLEGRMKQESRGTVTSKGLRPDRFVEKKPNAADEGLQFDWTARKVTFERGNNRNTSELTDNTVDWLSMIFQLAHVPPPQGAETLQLRVFTQRRLYKFDLKVLGIEEIKIPLGNVRALHLRHIDPVDQQVVDVWLGVDHHYLPVKMRYPVARNRFMVEQSAHASLGKVNLARAQLDAIVHALAAVLPAHAPADTQLRQFFRDNKSLGHRDRALIADTVYAALRRRRLLEHVTPGATPREMALATIVKLQGVGLGQIESVLKGAEKTWLAELKGRNLDELPLAIRADLPDWVIERLRKRMSEEELLALARGLQQAAPLDLRVNTHKAPRAAVLDRLAYDEIEARPTSLSPVGVRLKEKPALNQHPMFLDGAVEVQDEGSQILGMLMEPRRGEMIVDFCAGAGGKTLQMGAAMNSSGRLYAFDISDKRLTHLAPRLKRSGLSNVFPQRIANENDAKVKRLRGKIDRVLVDAPCTGLGTLRRNPDLKSRQSAQGLAELTVKQKSILAAAASLVKPGGRLVYGTCSLLTEENEEIVSDFLAANADFTLIPAAEVLKRQGISLPGVDPYLRLYPHVHDTDGFFAAVMERKK